MECKVFHLHSWQLTTRNPTSYTATSKQKTIENNDRTFPQVQRYFLFKISYTDRLMNRCLQSEEINLTSYTNVRRILPVIVTRLNVIAGQRMTYVAENHGLGDGEAPVQITQRCELVLLPRADHAELLDCVKRLLFSLQPDDIGVGNHLLRKLQHGVLEGCREEEHLAVLAQLPAENTKGFAAAD